MIHNQDNTQVPVAFIPVEWVNFYKSASLDEINPSRIVITFEDLDPPRDTHQSRVRIFRNKVGRVFIGKAKPSKETRLLLDALTTAILELRRTQNPALPLLSNGPVLFRLGLFYRWPKSTSKAKASRTEFKVTRPDADNLVKTIQDGLTVRNVITDDSQIAVLEVRKYNSPKPGLVLSIESLSL